MTTRRRERGVRREFASELRYDRRDGEEIDVDDTMNEGKVAHVWRVARPRADR